jgi:hypothetical protein
VRRLTKELTRPPPVPSLHCRWLFLSPPSHKARPRLRRLTIKRMRGMIILICRHRCKPRLDWPNPLLRLRRKHRLPGLQERSHCGGPHIGARGARPGRTVGEGPEAGAFSATRAPSRTSQRCPEVSWRAARRQKPPSLGPFAGCLLPNLRTPPAVLKMGPK